MAAPWSRPVSWAERVQPGRLLIVVAALVVAGGIGLMVGTIRLKLVVAILGIVFASGVALARPDLGLLLLILADSAELSRVASADSPFTAVRVFGALTLLSWLAQGGATGVGRRLASPQLTFLVCYFLVAMSSLFYADRPELSVPILREYFMIFLFFLLVAALVRSRQQVRWLSWTLVVSAVASVALAVRQYEPHMERLGSTQSNPNYFALSLVAVLPIVVYLAIGERSRLARLLTIPAAGLLIWAIAKSFSRGAFLGLAVALLIVLVHLATYPRRSSRALLAPLLAVMAVTAVVLPMGYADRVKSITVTPGQADWSIERRMLTNKANWEIFRDHPVLGVGVGNSWPLTVLYRYQIGQASAPHNIVLEVAAETGVVGFTFFALALGFAFHDLGRSARIFREQGDWLMYALACGYLVGLVGFLVTALFKTATVVRILWLLVAASVVMRNVANEESAPEGVA